MYTFQDLPRNIDEPMILVLIFLKRLPVFCGAGEHESLNRNSQKLVPYHIYYIRSLFESTQRVYIWLQSYFLFLQEQLKGIIIKMGLYRIYALSVEVHSQTLVPQHVYFIQSQQRVLLRSCAICSLSTHQQHISNTLATHQHHVSTTLATHQQHISNKPFVPCRRGWGSLALRHAPASF